MSIQPTNTQIQRNYSFNVNNHIPPKYNIFGYMLPAYKRQKAEYILSQKESTKSPWNYSTKNESNTKTQQELIEYRKKQKITDISYDLDKDGYVGNKDFVIAKLYDKDNDGKLNESEQKAAYEGIAKGITNKYIWNLDNQGGVRPYRIMQKRGKIVDADDYSQIKETYPKHPISDIQPKCRTYEELKEHRKKETKDYIQQKQKEWDNKLDDIVYDIRDLELSKNKPEHRSYSEIRNEKEKKGEKRLRIIRTHN